MSFVRHFHDKGPWRVDVRAADLSVEPPVLATNLVPVLQRMEVEERRWATSPHWRSRRVPPEFVQQRPIENFGPLGSQLEV